MHQTPLGISHRQLLASQHNAQGSLRGSQTSRQSPHTHSCCGWPPLLHASHPPWHQTGGSAPSSWLAAPLPPPLREGAPCLLPREVPGVCFPCCTEKPVPEALSWLKHTQPGCRQQHTIARPHQPSFHQIRPFQKALLLLSKLFCVRTRLVDRRHPHKHGMLWGCKRPGRFWQESEQKCAHCSRNSCN